MKTSKIQKIAAVLILIAFMVGCVGKAEAPVARSGYQQCKVYTEQGCSSFVVASGGTLAVESGGTFSNAGTLTVLPGITLAGTSNVPQLTLRGYTTQTLPILVVENSSGINKATIENTGNTTISGTLSVVGATALESTLAVTGYSNLNGGIYDSSGDLNLRDNTTISGTLAITGASTLTGALAANGGLSVDSPAFTVANGTGAVATGSTLSVGDDATLQESVVISQTTVSLVNGNNNLTVDVSMYTIDASTNVSITLATTNAVPGQLLYIYDQDNVAVVINDTNVKTSSGAALTLGQYDLVAFIFDGTNWIEMFLIANS